MYLMEAIVASIGLSFDVLAISICEGSKIADIDKKKLISMCIIFAVWQIIAMQLGILITCIPIFNYPDKELQTVWHILSGIIILGLGAYMLYQAFHSKEVEERRSEIRLKNMNALATITSFDAFFAGISFGILDIQAVVTIMMLGIITVLFVVMGVYIGYHMGSIFKNRVYGIGSILLIVVGIEYLIRYLC